MEPHAYFDAVDDSIDQVLQQNEPNILHYGTLKYRI